MDQHNQNQTKPKLKLKIKSKTSNFFLGCFGISMKPADSPEKSYKQRTSWFSRSTALLKQSAGGGTKTVPIDSDEKIPSKMSFKTLKKKKKLKIKTADSDIEVSVKQKNPPADPLKSPASAPEVTAVEGPKEVCDKKVVKENGKLLDVGADSPNKLSFRKKLDAIRNGSFNLTDPKSKSNRTISRSTSVLTALNSPENSPAIRKKDRNKETEITGNRFDQVIGMSIVMVTLIIMLFWGRLCAILCTCAWLYFVPVLRAPNEMRKNGPGLGEPNFDSDEYKRRVVLEGFLERNNRSLL
ncbi:uncharacterized protein At5g23160 [Mercurialis annua]|uniref:uncharacterized protein At5g23160 n=1 Tax=Mercurialis annua TaxID=3986 RepID=UPI00215ED631|nr:uncharacterized protein At5g23160 [Mercurialis annua]